MRNSVNISVDRYDHMLKSIWELKLKIEKEQELVNEMKQSIYKQEEQIIELLHKQVKRMIDSSYSVKKEDICIVEQTTGLSYLDRDIADLLNDYHEDIQIKVWEMLKDYGSDVNQ